MPIELSEEFINNMNDIESELAKTFGFVKRKLRIENYNQQNEFNRYIEQQIKKYKAFYPDITNTELDYVVQQLTPLLKDIVSEEATKLEGQFDRDCPDEIFLASNKLQSETHAKRVLVHESLHAMIFDYLNGKGTTLKTYANPNYTTKFCENLIKENKIRPLIKQTYTEKFKDNGGIYYQEFSFEENFVMYNTLAYMLEQELNTSTPNVTNIRSLVDEYIIQANLINRKQFENTKVPFKNKKVFIRDYLTEVMNDLLYNPENQDKLQLIQKDYSRKEIKLEIIPSNIPNIIPILIDNRLQSYKLKPTNKMDMRKIEKLDNEFYNVVEENKKQATSFL